MLSLRGDKTPKNNNSVLIINMLVSVCGCSIGGFKQNLARYIFSPPRWVASLREGGSIEKGRHSELDGSSNK